MILKPFLFLVLITTASYVEAQLNIRKPLICHDEDNYLRCYNDGTFILNFDKGNFKKFSTVDSNINYSDATKTLNVIGKLDPFATDVDTFEIKLRSRSIYINKGASTLELTSDTILPEIYSIGFGTQLIRFDTLECDRRFTSLVLHIDRKEVEFQISTFWETWSWNIIIRQPRYTAAISYNGYKKNRFENVFIRDDSLKYGTSISATFRSLKKISELHSLYVDTIMIHSELGYGDIIPLEDGYSYRYKKNGRLKTVRPPNDFKKCDCD